MNRLHLEAFQNFNRRPFMNTRSSSIAPETLNPEAFAALGGPDLVYVRAVKARDVLGDEPEETLEQFSITPDQTLYALYRADGARLAVLSDRDSAFAAALAHELAPVSVH
jgi:hypothetical protein